LRGIPSVKGVADHLLQGREDCVAACEAKIEAIVARLYGLTDAECTIIEGKER